MPRDTNQESTKRSSRTRRIPSSSSSLSPNALNTRKYVTKNLETVFHDRKLQATTGYVPGFEGYISIAFSVHIPFWELLVDDLEQERLESLVMLFLCSQGVQLVISTDPTSLIPVCPFNDIGSNTDNYSNGNNSNNNAKIQASMTRSAVNSVAAMGDDDNAEHMIVWNLPRFETLTLPFEEKELVLDMATNTTHGEAIARDGQPNLRWPQQHYTQLNFTYPVYQWGSEDSVVASELQAEFDASVVRTGTLDGLLPWPNVQTASIGNEPYVFWDEPLPLEPRYFDTEIPQDVTLILQYLGIGLLVANTMVVLVLSCVARIQGRRAENRMKRRREEYRRHRLGGPEYLDTEAGVSAILLESKQYALTKTLGSSSPTRGANLAAVEVGLSRSPTRSTRASSRASSPIEKEIKLLERAKQQTNTNSNSNTINSNGDGSNGGGITSSTQWFAEKKNLNSVLGDYEVEVEAENLQADFQMLNLE